MQVIARLATASRSGAIELRKLKRRPARDTSPFSPNSCQSRWRLATRAARSGNRQSTSRGGWAILQPPESGTRKATGYHALQLFRNIWPGHQRDTPPVDCVQTRITSFRNGPLRIIMRRAPGADPLRFTKIGATDQKRQGPGHRVPVTGYPRTSEAYSLDITVAH